MATFELAGQTFGRLTAIERATNKGKKTAWLCRCTCGNSKAIRTYSLMSGRARSCGCIRIERLIRFGHERKATDPLVIAERRKRKTRADYFRSIKNKYGLSQAEYEEMARKQNFRCAICNQEKPLCVDHEHETRRVRSLLCSGCNCVLGYSLENIETLQNAVRYLEHH